MAVLRKTDVIHLLVEYQMAWPHNTVVGVSTHAQACVTSLRDRISACEDGAG